MKTHWAIFIIALVLGCGTSGERGERPVIDYEGSLPHLQESLEDRYFEFYQKIHPPRVLVVVDTRRLFFMNYVKPPDSIIYRVTVDSKGKASHVAIKPGPWPYMRYCERRIKAMEFDAAKMAHINFDSVTDIYFDFRPAAQ